MAKPSKVGTPRVVHQDDIQELIDNAIMEDRVKRKDFDGGTSDLSINVVDNNDGTSTLTWG